LAWIPGGNLQLLPEQGWAAEALFRSKKAKNWSWEGQSKVAGAGFGHGRFLSIGSYLAVAAFSAVWPAQARQIKGTCSSWGDSTLSQSAWLAYGRPITTQKLHDSPSPHHWYHRQSLCD
jgi:hypothetical protein